MQPFLLDKGYQPVWLHAKSLGYQKNGIESGAVFPLFELKQVDPVDSCQAGELAFAEPGIFAETPEHAGNCFREFGIIFHSAIVARWVDPLGVLVYSTICLYNHSSTHPRCVKGKLAL